MFSKTTVSRFELTRLCVCVALLYALCSVVCAQEPSDRASSDTNNAVIEGRVILPSGNAADRNIRITLSNSRSILYTLYSNKHGEFRFPDLSEGVYFVQAEADRTKYDPVVTKVILGRGIVWQVRLQLVEEKTAEVRRPGGNVVSAGELHQQVPIPAKKEYDLALKQVAKGDVPKAAAHFKQAIEIFPEYIAAHNDLGAQYLKLKQLDEAEGHLRIALGQDPTNFNAKFNMGLVRIERRDYTNAISQLNDAMRIDSAHASAHLWLGFALLETGDLVNAERELAKSLVMGGADCVAAHYYLARVYTMRGDSAEAAKSARAYLEEAPRGEYAKEAAQLAHGTRVK